VKAFLLAAGFGSRLKPLTDTLPKCLVPINGKPLLDYWLTMLTEAGIGPILVNLHYLADTVMGHLVQSKYRANIIPVFESQLLGTGGSVLKNKELLGREPFFLVHADNLSHFDPRAFMARHSARPGRCDITMMTFVTDSPQTCGIVDIDAEGVVTNFREKPENASSRLANAAVYIVEPTVLLFLETLGRDIIDFSQDVIPHYLGRIYTFHNTRYHRDIGTPESYEHALRDSAFLGAI
jgi:mannose-1-phosphate guanylyltransferase